MNGIDSARQISARPRAIRQTNFSDSITHGPRMNAGCLPPSMTERILSGFGFKSAYSSHFLDHHKSQRANRARSKKRARAGVVEEDKPPDGPRERSEAKRPRVCAAGSRSFGPSRDRPRS